MRIRKNAKISPLVYPASSPTAGAAIQTHFCQLNQSPWDVMSFSPPASPPPSQENKSDVCAANGCSPNNVPVVERKLDADRKCLFVDGDDTTTNKTEEKPHDVKDEHVILCCKTNGKSWRRRMKAAKGNSSCDHRLSLPKNYNNLNQSKKLDKSGVETRRCTRPKKAPASSSSNPYEFYYYSGFGPTWGKRKGESRKNICSDTSQNFEHEHGSDPSLLSQFDEDSDIFYAEEEYEDGENGKKRGRKPIKARSLKSLM